MTSVSDWHVPVMKNVNAEFASTRERHGVDWSGRAHPTVAGRRSWDWNRPGDFRGATDGNSGMWLQLFRFLKLSKWPSVELLELSTVFRSRSPPWLRYNAYQSPPGPLLFTPLWNQIINCSDSTSAKCKTSGLRLWATAARAETSTSCCLSQLSYWGPMKVAPQCVQ